MLCSHVQWVSLWIALTLPSFELTSKYLIHLALHFVLCIRIHTSINYAGYKSTRFKTRHTPKKKLPKRRWNRSHTYHFASVSMYARQAALLYPAIWVWVDKLHIFFYEAKTHFLFHERYLSACGQNILKPYLYKRAKYYRPWNSSVHIQLPIDFWLFTFLSHSLCWLSLSLL